MPFIRTEEVREIRNALKKELPEFKISVRKRHHSGVSVTILAGPDLGLDMKNDTHQINHFWYERNYEDNQVMLDLCKKVLDTIDNAKPQREVVYDGDYGSVPNYYKDIQIGDYNKPYIVRG